VTAGFASAVHDTVTRGSQSVWTALLMHMYFVMFSDALMGCIFSFW